MANRSELSLIRAARAGQASAQLMLGRRYLFGGAGLPKNLAIALYWLDRAAHQDEKDAWLLIGSHVPFETVRQTTQPSKLCVWYERAFDAGIAQAGLVLARLVLEQVPGAVSESMRSKALRALQAAAQAGIAEAQWMLAQHIGESGASRPLPPAAGAASALPHLDNEAMREWAKRAAQSGIVEARYALADHAWASADRTAFLNWALPLARERMDAVGVLNERDAGLVARCAHALYTDDDAIPEAVRFWERAAQAGDRGARFSLGLHYARMDAGGRRTGRAGVANYKKATRWLSLAAEQGVVDAWYALSKIYLKPECSQRSVADAQRYLERAAQAGHAAAQLELGVIIWRARRDQPGNDLRALHWLQKAQVQGVAEAATIIDKIAARAVPAPWACTALQCLTQQARDAYPLLTVRLELAARFGLTRTEALLVEPADAIAGECLVVDIPLQHAQRTHGHRRLILARDAGDREVLDRIARVFEGIEPGPDGPEGNYRRRLYRLKTLLPG
jgi:uncharacterized protein